ncbi:MAG: amino acid ABC transporter ATP-binding protein [Clostridiales bacterium]|nr:amino acid ABC transporter ATP-binding protein [Clostridiales bacterium]
MKKMIEVKNLKKSFGDLQVLKDVSFDISEGEVVAVLGPSGSGKSTMLRCLIDLETIDGGSVLIEGESFFKDGAYAKKKQKKAILDKMGMVFQHFNLFPHMNITENMLCAPLCTKQGSKKELQALCSELLEKVGLSDKKDAMPSQLSGGQKQRVAIARALMRKPDIMLFDEPTSALDPELTKEVLDVIKELSAEKMTMVIVTHEIGFAAEAADKIVFLDEGVVAACGTPDEVLKNSGNERINAFLNKVM